MRTIAGVGFGVMVLCAAAPRADAATNLVLNGGFTSTTSGAAVSEQVVSPNSKGGQTLSNWTNSGYDRVSVHLEAVGPE